eukprot:scaffold221341_cov32-Attheya_sp.AAC.1
MPAEMTPMFSHHITRDMSESIYGGMANTCGVDQYHIDTAEKILSWKEPQCNLDIHDRPMVDSKGNVYVLNARSKQPQ